MVDSTLNNCGPEKALRFLDFPVEQRRLVLQLGGSSAPSLAAASRIAARFGYSALNLNCGCPSPRVAGEGCFGAALMSNPGGVAAACAAMRDASGLPVSVKCRTGVDDADSYEQLAEFVHAVSARGGVSDFTIHARKALLCGLSPEENRRVPPLQYARVLALARDFPALRFTLNGGLRSLGEAAAALRHAPLAGVMLGRAAAERPWDVLGDVDRALHGEANPASSRRQLLADYCAYADAARAAARGGAGHPRLRALARPLLNLFSGAQRGNSWRRELDAQLLAQGRGREPPTSFSALVERAASVLPAEALDAAPPRCEPAEEDARALEARMGEMPPRRAAAPA